MPIRPEMRHLYPPPAEWKKIRARILARAGGVCECRGECGARHQGGRCAVANGAYVVRRTHPDGSIEASPRPASSPYATRIVLTIAHLDHDPTRNDDANLRALCQLCHLRYDRHEHAKNAAATRARRRDGASGQRGLFGGGS